MPRKSPFEIVLDNKERQHLTSLARKHTAPFRDIIRAQVILLAAKGMENNRSRSMWWASVVHTILGAALDSFASL